MIKLQVVIYPATEASAEYGLNPQHLSSMLQLQSQLGQMNLWPNPARKLLHLTTSTKTLMEVCEEVKNRYAKLYPNDEPLQVEQVRDSLSCDLDPDYLVGDIFANGDTIQFVVNNTFESGYNVQTANILERLVTLNDGHDDSTSRINPHSMTPGGLRHANSSSTPIATPAPLLSRKRLSNFFETTDSNLPRKVRKSIWNDSTNQSFVQKASGGRRGRKPKETPNSTIQQDLSSPIHESNISLPPPDLAPSEEEIANIIPLKRSARTPAKSRSVQRVTSGMLSVPAETQQESSKGVDRVLDESTPVSNKVSNGTNGVNSVVSKRRGKSTSTNANITSSNGEVITKSRARKSRKDSEVEKGEKMKEKSIPEVQIPEDLVDTMTKDEIMGLFLNGMKLPSKRAQNYNSKQVQTLKSLQITMNDEGTISTTGRTMGEVEPERTSRQAAQEASKKLKEEVGRKKKQPEEKSVTTITNSKYGTTIATTSKIELAKEDGSRRARWERRNSNASLAETPLTNRTRSRSRTRPQKLDKDEAEESKTPSRRRRSRSKVQPVENGDIDMDKSLDKDVTEKKSVRRKEPNAVEDVTPVSQEIDDIEMMDIDSPTGKQSNKREATTSKETSTSNSTKPKENFETDSSNSEENNKIDSSSSTENSKIDSSSSKELSKVDSPNPKENIKVDSAKSTQNGKSDSVISDSSASSTASKLSKLFDRVRTIDKTINPSMGSTDSPGIDMDASTVPNHALPAITLESQGRPKTVGNPPVEKPLSVLERARLGLKIKQAAGATSSTDDSMSNFKKNGYNGLNYPSLEERQKAEKQRIKKRAEQLRLAKQNLDKARRQSAEKAPKNGAADENGHSIENPQSESSLGGNSGNRPNNKAENNKIVHASSSDDDISASENESEEEGSKRNPRVVDLPTQGSVLKRPGIKSYGQRGILQNKEALKPTKPESNSPEHTTPSSTVSNGVQAGSGNSTKPSLLSRLPTLTSLSDLAMRGVPEVRDSNSSKFGLPKHATVETKKVASSGEDSSDSSSSDDDSGSGSESDYKDAKFINSKKFKKTTKKGGFFDLMKDANKI